jgi:7-carboxy-7-deazaguanine synthase
MSMTDVLAAVHEFGCNLVEVTGGEPLASKSGFALIEQLCDADYQVLVETGGFASTEEVDQRASVILDVKCPGSGEAERNHWPNLNRLRSDRDEVKFVIAGRHDWEFARDVISTYKLEHRAKAILISPVWNAIPLSDVADWVSASGLDVRMQLQMHKQIWGADARGV